jgi:hypothetical protein
VARDEEEKSFHVPPGAIAFQNRSPLPSVPPTSPSGRYTRPPACFRPGAAPRWAPSRKTAAPSGADHLASDVGEAAGAVVLPLLPKPPPPPPPPPRPPRCRDAASAGAISSTCWSNPSLAATAGARASRQRASFLVGGGAHGAALHLGGDRKSAAPRAIFTRGSILTVMGWVRLWPFAVKRTEYARSRHGELTPGYVRCGTRRCSATPSASAVPGVGS